MEFVQSNNITLSNTDTISLDVCWDVRFNVVCQLKALVRCQSNEELLAVNNQVGGREGSSAKLNSAGLQLGKV